MNIEPATVACLSHRDGIGGREGWELNAGGGKLDAKGCGSVEQNA